MREREKVQPLRYFCPVYIGFGVWVRGCVCIWEIEKLNKFSFPGAIIITVLSKMLFSLYLYSTVLNKTQSNQYLKTHSCFKKHHVHKNLTLRTESNTVLLCSASVQPSKQWETLLHSQRRHLKELIATDHLRLQARNTARREWNMDEKHSLKCYMWNNMKRTGWRDL